MKLYKISQSSNTGWYTYDNAIVVANSKEAARRIIPSCFYFYDEAFYYKYKNQEPIVEKVDPSWCNPKHVKVELIGSTNLPDGTIVCSSYNAGFDESRYLDMRKLKVTLQYSKDPIVLAKAQETMDDLQAQLKDRSLAELRYHLIEANRAHDLKKVQEYELKLMDYMNQDYEDWA